MERVYALHFLDLYIRPVMDTLPCLRLRMRPVLEERNGNIEIRCCQRRDAGY